MNVFLTVAGEAPVIEKVWNLVDWAITKFGLPVNASIAANIAGALLCIVVPYLLGSISPAIIISQRVCGTDIRTVGRKTAGTYNMLVSLGSKMAVVSALCEFFVAYISVWFGRIVWGANGAGLALFFVVLGNLFPIFYRLSGGKGIATMIGAAAALHPIVAALLIVVFVISVFATKLVALFRFCIRFSLRRLQTRDCNWQWRCLLPFLFFLRIDKTSAVCRMAKKKNSILATI